MRISYHHAILSLILTSVVLTGVALRNGNSGDAVPANRMPPRPSEPRQRATVDEPAVLQPTPSELRLIKVPGGNETQPFDLSMQEPFRFSPVSWLSGWREGSGLESYEQESVPSVMPGTSLIDAQGLAWQPVMGGVGGDSSCGPCGRLGDLDLGGPWREPSAGRYRIRGGDILQFTYQQTREPFAQSYRLAYGDQVRVSSDTHPELNVTEPIEIMPDGTISIPGLQSVAVADLTLAEARLLLEEKLVTIGKYHSPRITLLPVRVYQRLNDLLAAVSSQFANGGQNLQLTVIRDGTLALPLIGTICVVGLTREELMAEINARYSQVVTGIAVTVNVIETAPAFVYVLGQVAEPGRLEARLPMTAWQAIAQAGGQLQGGNLQQVVILRRTEDWRLVATTLDFSSANRAQPNDFQDLWLWDSDVILVPKSRIQRADELINLYLTQGLFSLFPSQLQLDSASVF